MAVNGPKIGTGISQCTFGTVLEAKDIWPLFNSHSGDHAVSRLLRSLNVFIQAIRYLARLFVRAHSDYATAPYQRGSM